VELDDVVRFTLPEAGEVQLCSPLLSGFNAALMCKEASLRILRRLCVRIGKILKCFSLKAWKTNYEEELAVWRNKSLYDTQQQCRRLALVQMSSILFRQGRYHLKIKIHDWYAAMILQITKFNVAHINHLDLAVREEKKRRCCMIRDGLRQEKKLQQQTSEMQIELDALQTANMQLVREKGELCERWEVMRDGNVALLQEMERLIQEKEQSPGIDCCVVKNSCAFSNVNVDA